MIRISALYPNRSGASFDHAYYAGQHARLLHRLLGPLGLRRFEADRGLGGGGAEPPFIAAGHLYFDSVEAFQSAWAVHGEELLADVPNYTDIQLTLQISEIAPQAELPPIPA